MTLEELRSEEQLAAFRCFVAEEQFKARRTKERRERLASLESAYHAIKARLDAYRESEGADHARP